MIDLVRPLADELGVDLYSAGTHPFAEWSHQLLTPGHRYEELIARTQWWGRQMLIWGVHVHVGVRREHVMPIVSALLKWYPHLQALSASSPIWAGTDTGYASNRAMMFQQLPTAGLPFQFETWADFEHYAEDLLTTGVIEEIDEIRWDVRPAPHLGTVEVRICDGVSTLWEMRALVALTHCLVVDLVRPARARREAARPCRRGTCRRTSGAPPATALDAWIILDEHSNERLMQDDLHELLEHLAPGRRAARLRRRARPGRGDPPARRVVPAPARGRRAHRRRPGRGRRLGRARALSSPASGRHRAGSGRWRRAGPSRSRRAGRPPASAPAPGPPRPTGRVVRSTCERGPAEPDQPVADGGRRPAGAELVGDRVGALGEVLQQVGVRRGDRLAPVGRHRDPAYEHAGVAQREVQRLDELGHRPHPALCRRRNGEERTTDSPSSEAARSSTTSSSVERASRSTSRARSTSPSRMLSAAARSSSGDLAHDDRRPARADGAAAPGARPQPRPAPRRRRSGRRSSG